MNHVCINVVKTMFHVRSSIETRATHLSGRSMSTIQAHLFSQQRTRSYVYHEVIHSTWGPSPCSIVLHCVRGAIVRKQGPESRVEKHFPAGQDDAPNK